MALTFPSSPTIGQRHFAGGQTWQWDGVRWNSFPDEGYRGSVGFKGSEGYKGSEGFRGSSGVGFQGSVGYTSSVGYSGSAGYRGSEGYRGSVGFQGSVGAIGPIGWFGSTGFKGSLGDAGPPGGATGYVGSMGYAGSAGFIGRDGYVGSLGIAAAQFQNTIPVPLENRALTAGELWFDTDEGIMSAYFPDQNVWLGINGGTVGFVGSVGRLDSEATLQFNNTVTFSNSVIINKTFIGSSVDMINYSEATKDHGTVSTSKTIYLSNGNIQYLTLGTNPVTLSFANTGMVENKGYSLTLIVTQDSVGSKTIAFDASTIIKWAAGSAPTLSTAANSIDMLTFFTGNKGAYWFGSLSGKNFS